MNLATVSASNALTAVTALLSGGKLTLYSGTQPTNAETATGVTNTVLATFTFASPAFGSSATAPGTAPSGAYEAQTASFVSSSTTPVANGTVTWARATMATSSWSTSSSYSFGNIVVANSNLYFCTRGGTANNTGTGPSGTSASITDGQSGSSNPVVWQYIGPSTATTVADFTVNTSAADIIIGNTSLQTTVNVTITTFILQIPAV